MSNMPEDKSQYVYKHSLESNSSLPSLQRERSLEIFEKLKRIPPHYLRQAERIGLLDKIYEKIKKTAKEYYETNDYNNE